MTQERVEMEQKTVVVTGTSSGIGRASALLLARNGFRVFAGVRKREHGDALRNEAGESVTPLVFDVTDDAAIAAAAKQVESTIDGRRGLDGLVNVAGVGVSSPLEFMRLSELRTVFDVNVFGQMAVTQAFLPLLRAARGRIVNISSVGAHIAIPFGGALCSSKAAFGLLSDSLRMELAPFGVTVCTIEPGATYTPAIDKTLGDVEGVIRGMPPAGATRYADMLRKFTKRAYARERGGSSPDVVAEAIRDALTAKKPKIRYIVGKDARQLTMLPRILSDRVLDGIRRKLFM
jgi:NAD(P)-dependent dehydrogenase (short-subunit alcohol dehydrogenase family)